MLGFKVIGAHKPCTQEKAKETAPSASDPCLLPQKVATLQAYGILGINDSTMRVDVNVCKTIDDTAVQSTKNTTVASIAYCQTHRFVI